MSEATADQNVHLSSPAIPQAENSGTISGSILSSHWYKDSHVSNALYRTIFLVHSDIYLGQLLNSADPQAWLQFRTQSTVH